MEDPAPIEAKIEATNDAVYWSPHAPFGGLAGVFKNGSPSGMFVHADVKRRAAAGLYFPPYVQININSNVEWQYVTGKYADNSTWMQNEFQEANWTENQRTYLGANDGGGGGGAVSLYGATGPDGATVVRSGNSLKIYAPKARNTDFGRTFINDQLPFNGSERHIKGGYNIYIFPASLDLKKFAFSTNPRNYKNLPTHYYLKGGWLLQNAQEIIEVRYDTSGILSYPTL
jgi:hypothetical protein